ncbi:unnamed protein product (macronuclear) [Paramecium tetraurelia]|uniref:C2HC/C3H-type domain-containing protein n=1 Tax=Paramecium tetraurelia TaxID=5888 RepID=A0EG46_PARTE|nr:uncharacterized protein GSPATT00026610001 [Paramecium tetraurelia]CAK94287.1 unnamed protein product [Paramecium tetraurelia]|eukprot:XP_001461660.1 hypothetical protein (macronuclear) [Paramecium tetraurelia strain d4-2]
MFKQSKQVSPSLYPQNPQNSFNKLFNVQTSATQKPKIDVVSRISKPLQNISNVPTRRQEDQTKKTQAKSPLKQTFQKNSHRNKSCIQNSDEKLIPKMNEKEKSPLQKSIKTSELSQSERPLTQQQQPIDSKSNEPNQQITNVQSDMKSQQNLNQQEVPVLQKQQSKLLIQSNQPKSLNNQQQQQKLSRPKTATQSQLQLKQTTHQDQQVKPTQQHQLTKTIHQTKSQETLNKKQEQPIKTRQQQKILKGELRFQDKLYECTEGCGRSFNAYALERHSKICKKVFQQKRKVFNSSKQRVIDVENNGQGRGIPVKRQLQMQTTKEEQKQGEVKNEKPNWKAQSEALRAIIRQAKGRKLGEEVSFSEGGESVEGLVQDRICSRKFSVETVRQQGVFWERKAQECGKSGMQKKKK